MHREDYKEAGFKMLVHEKNGAARTALKSLLYMIILIGFTYAPLWIPGNEVSLWYLILNSLLSVYAIYHAVRFLNPNNRDGNAKSLFFSTILYLPVFMILFALDRYL